DRQHATGHELVPIVRHQPPSGAHPVPFDRAVVVGDEHDLVSGLADADVPAPADPPAWAGDDAGAGRGELRNKRSESRIPALVDDEDLGRAWLASGPRIEEQPNLIDSSDSRDDDGYRERMSSLLEAGSHRGRVGA